MRRRIPTKEIRAIKQARRTGHSIPEISTKLKMSRSTVSRYVKGVAVLPKFKQRLLDRRNASKIIAERNWLRAHEKAAQLINHLTHKELALVATALYWGEGAKRDFSFTNSDPAMIEVFIRIMKKVFGITSERFKVSLRTYDDLDQQACIRFWSKVTGIKLTGETSINVLRGSKQGKLPFGMCRVRIQKGGLILKEIFAIIKRIHSII